MFLRFSEKDIKLCFNIAEDDSVLLSSFSNVEKEFAEERVSDDVYSAVAIHISGENPDDHHGAKHTGTSCEKTLKYVNHLLYKNNYGNKLEIELKNEKIRVILNYQFFEEISTVKLWTDVVNISDKSYL